MTADEILPAAAWIRRDGPLDHALSLGIAEPWASCARPDFGTEVTAGRSSWTRWAAHPAGAFFVKVYVYPDLRSRVRGALRNTWLARSRPHREWAALRWLRSRGFAGPRPWGVAEQRDRFGALHRAVLVTAAWPAPSLEQLLPTLEPDDVGRVTESLHGWVRELHRCGFRDRNLDPRNILARQVPGSGWQFTKIDSPRYRLRPAAAEPRDALVEQDLARLEAGLQRLRRARADQNAPSSEKGQRLETGSD